MKLPMMLQFIPVTWSPGRHWRCWMESLLPVTVRTVKRPAGRVPLGGAALRPPHRAEFQRPSEPFSTTRLWKRPEGRAPGTMTGGVPAGRCAFTLIEMIGVMAVLAITATMLLPPLTAQTDNAVAAQEAALTQSFITALQNNIQRNHVIPGATGATNWVSIVATELGMNPTNVAFTVRNQPRVLLVDTNGFGKMSLPYIETSGCMPDALTNSTLPRIMVVSSLGAALPASFVTNTSGGTPLSDFSNLWVAASGTVPTNGAWTGWTGKPGDITVQRLNVGYLFAHVVLSNLDPTNTFYSINGVTNTLAPAFSQSNAYYLTATVLNLYLANTNLEASQILNNDSSWEFSGGGWRNAAAPAPTGTIYTNSGAAIVASAGDIISISRQCSAQSFCTNAWNSGMNPNQVCNDITNFMGCYQKYANNSFTHDGVIWPALQSACTKLNNDCNTLCP